MKRTFSSLLNAAHSCAWRETNASASVYARSATATMSEAETLLWKPNPMWNTAGWIAQPILGQVLVLVIPRCNHRKGDGRLVSLRVGRRGYLDDTSAWRAVHLHNATVASSHPAIRLASRSDGIARLPHGTVAARKQVHVRVDRRGEAEHQHALLAVVKIAERGRHLERDASPFLVSGRARRRATHDQSREHTQRQESSRQQEIASTLAAAEPTYRLAPLAGGPPVGPSLCAIARTYSRQQSFALQHESWNPSFVDQQGIRTPCVKPV